MGFDQRHHRLSFCAGDGVAVKSMNNAPTPEKNRNAIAQ